MMASVQIGQQTECLCPPQIYILKPILQMWGYWEVISFGDLIKSWRWSPHEWQCCCSVAKTCLTLCDPTDCSRPGLLVLYHLPESAQVHVHCIGDAIQPSHPLSPSSPSAFSLSQGQGLFQWVSCSISTLTIEDLESAPKSFLHVRLQKKTIT